MSATKEHYHDEIEKGQRETNVKKPYIAPTVKKIARRRNDPCGCGSGLKFKNCCQNKIRLGLQKRVIDARVQQRKKS